MASKKYQNKPTTKRVLNLSPHYLKIRLTMRGIAEINRRIQNAHIPRLTVDFPNDLLYEVFFYSSYPPKRRNLYLRDET